MSRRGFASDNQATVHPAVLEAIARANVGHAPSYGDDATTAAAVARFRELLGDAVDVLFVANGTGANVVGLRALLRPWDSVITTAMAHLNVHECGALELAAGAKVIALPSDDGKLTPAQVAAHAPVREPHNRQSRVVSITQPTELGTLYSADDLAGIARTAHAIGLYLHVDGARICNAAAALGCSLRAITADAGVDVLSFGGTKNGLLGGEAVVFFRPELAESARFIRMQQTQLVSKMRFVSAQFLALLEGDLWRDNAAHANAMARRLEGAVRAIPGVRITQKVETNAVFAALPPAAIPALQAEIPFYTWDERRDEVRWMCAWDTTEADVDGFAARIAEVVAALPPAGRIS